MLYQRTTPGRDLYRVTPFTAHGRSLAQDRDDHGRDIRMMRLADENWPVLLMPGYGSPGARLLQRTMRLQRFRDVAFYGMPIPPS